MCAALLGLMLVCSTRILPLTSAAPSPSWSRRQLVLREPTALRCVVALQPRVDVACAGDFELLESFGQRQLGDDLFGDLARRFAQLLGQLERKRQGKLAHLDRGRLVDDDVRQLELVLVAEEGANGG